MIAEFFKPETIEEALALKKQYGKAVYYLGGGTKINNQAMAPHPEMVISLAGLSLTRIEKKGQKLRIGAGVTLQALIDSQNPTLPEPLRLAAGHTVSRNIRNMATVGGDIASGSSDAALVPFFMAVGAQLEIAPQGAMELETYLNGERQELITAVTMPAPIPPCVVERISQHVCGPALISVAVALEKRQNGAEKYTIIVGTVRDRIMRLREVEQALAAGTLTDPETIQTAVSRSVFPNGEEDQSLNYKRYLCGVVVADSIQRCRTA